MGPRRSTKNKEGPLCLVEMVQLYQGCRRFWAPQMVAKSKGKWDPLLQGKSRLVKLPSLKLTCSPPENQWLVQMKFPFWGKRPIFRGKLAISFRECIV